MLEDVMFFTIQNFLFSKLCLVILFFGSVCSLKLNMQPGVGWKLLEHVDEEINFIKPAASRRYHKNVYGYLRRSWKEL